jgi:hypothetical protein
MKQPSDDSLNGCTTVEVGRSAGQNEPLPLSMAVLMIEAADSPEGHRRLCGV